MAAAPFTNFTVAGPSAELRRLSGQLKQQGAPPQVRRELSRAVGGGLKVMVTEIRQAAAGLNLPSAGGLEGSHKPALVKGVKARVRVSGRGAGGEVGYGIGSGGTAMTKYGRISVAKFSQALEQGEVRHPLYGNSSYWYVTETGTEGWFGDASRRAEPEVVREMTERISAFVRAVCDPDGFSYVAKR